MRERRSPHLHAGYKRDLAEIDGSRPSSTVPLFWWRVPFAAILRTTVFA